MAVTVTYYEPYPETFPDYKVPRLYRVDYAETTDGVEARFQRSLLDHQVNQWLEANCKGHYYHSPGWDKKKYIQFEDDRDAVMFALRWS